MNILKAIIFFTLVWILNGCKKDTPEAITVEDGYREERESPEVPVESGGRIPVLAWYGLQGQFATTANYKDMADAGFTINIPGWTGDLDVDNATLASLNAAHANGIKVMFHRQVISRSNATQMTRLKEHPAFWGYFVDDEPTAPHLATVGNWVRSVKAQDNRKPVYVNFTGGLVTSVGISGILDKMDLPFISFDHYPITEEGGMRVVNPGFYDLLEKVSVDSRKIGIPIWGFALSVAHMNYPVPTIADLRLQVYSNLAYGVQGIQYYTYATHDGDPQMGYREGPLDIQRNKTPTYTTIQTMNNEIKALSKVFLGSTVIWTAHTGEIPYGCTPLNSNALPVEVESLEVTGGEGALVSLLKRGEDNFLVIVNRDIKNEAQVRVTGDVLRIVKKDGKVVVPANTPYTLTSGDALIYFWKGDSMGVPVEKIVALPSTLTLQVGKSAQVAPNVFPQNATDKSVIWETSNPAVATVANGYINARGAGTATITVISKAHPNVRTRVEVSVLKSIPKITLKTPLPSHVAYLKATDPLVFTWESEENFAGGYVLSLHASLDPSVSLLTIPVTNGTSVSVLPTTIESAVSHIVSDGQSGTIYWTVKPLQSTDIAESPIPRALIASRRIPNPPKSLWTIDSFSSVLGSGNANGIIDDNLFTFWHTNNLGSWAPQWAIIDFSATTSVSGISYHNRNAQDLVEPRDTHAAPRSIRFEVSNDKVNWELLLEREVPNTRTQQLLDAALRRTGRYMRVTILTNWSNATFSYVGEISVY